jgi:hypothetical protein
VLDEPCELGSVEHDLGTGQAGVLVAGPDTAHVDADLLEPDVDARLLNLDLHALVVLLGDWCRGWNRRRAGCLRQAGSGDPLDHVPVEDVVDVDAVCEPGNQRRGRPLPDRCVVLLALHPPPARPGRGVVVGVPERVVRVALAPLAEVRHPVRGVDDDPAGPQGLGSIDPLLDLSERDERDVRGGLPVELDEVAGPEPAGRADPVRQVVDLGLDRRIRSDPVVGASGDRALSSLGAEQVPEVAELPRDERGALGGLHRHDRQRRHGSFVADRVPVRDVDPVDLGHQILGIRTYGRWTGIRCRRRASSSAR